MRAILHEDKALRQGIRDFSEFCRRALYLNIKESVCGYLICGLDRRMDETFVNMVVSMGRRNT